MKIISFVSPYIMRYKKSFIFFVSLNIIGWIISIIIPNIIGNYIDILIKVKSIKILYSIIIVILIFYVINIIASYFGNVMLTKLQTKVAFDMNFSILEHVKKLPLLYFEKVDSVYLNQKVNIDTNALSTFLLSTVLNSILKILTFIILIPVLFNINKRICIYLTIILPIYILVYKVFKKPLFKYGLKLKESQNVFFSIMNEQINNIRSIKINALYTETGNKLKNDFVSLYQHIVKYTKISCMFSSCDTIVMNISQILILLIGGINIIKGRMTVGELTKVESYFSMIFSCTSYFLNAGKIYQDALVSYKRLEEIINEPEEKNGHVSLNSINNISLKNICFYYDKKEAILNNYSYEFEKGNIYLIHGKNGSGKSTLISLIIGLFNDCYTGEIKYNSIDIKDIDLYNLRKVMIGFLDQDPNLLLDNNLVNIKLNIKKIKIDTLSQMIDGIDIDFFNNVQNYKKVNILSGGEKQRLVFVKEVLKNGDLLILDEPTSALDSKSNQLVIKTLSEIKKNKIIIIVSHDESLNIIADQVIKLQN